MCFKSTIFTLNYKNIGVGYKAIHKRYIIAKANGKFSITYRDHYVGDRNPKLSKRWINAEDAPVYMSDSRNKNYRQGFHIFLKPEHAGEYGDYWLYYYHIVKVEFKDIIAFGKNTGAYNGVAHNCIVANRMRVVEIVK